MSLLETRLYLGPCPGGKFRKAPANKTQIQTRGRDQLREDRGRSSEAMGLSGQTLEILGIAGLKKTPWRRTIPGELSKIGR